MKLFVYREKWQNFWVRSTLNFNYWNVIQIHKINNFASCWVFYLLFLKLNDFRLLMCLKIVNLVFATTKLLDLFLQLLLAPILNIEIPFSTFSVHGAINEVFIFVVGINSANCDGVNWTAVISFAHVEIPGDIMFCFEVQHVHR